MPETWRGSRKKIRTPEPSSEPCAQRTMSAKPWKLSTSVSCSAKRLESGVCVRASERERKREGAKETEREREARESSDKIIYLALVVMSECFQF